MLFEEASDALAAIESGAQPSQLESGTLDFKEVGRSVQDALRDLAEAATCFANAAGGTIIVGLRDNATGRAAFVGSPLDPVMTVGRIYELTDPGLIVIASTHTRCDETLTVITVPASPDVHQVGGRATERVGTSCQPMSSSRIATVLADRRGDDWSNKDSGRSLNEASPAAVELARDLLSQGPDRERSTWARVSWPDLARRLGVSVGENLTNAGALLFTDTDTGHGRYVRRAANAGLLAANEDLRGPAVAAIRRALELVHSRTERVAIITPAGRQLLLDELPSAAVREAIVNAFIHRDYRSTGEILIEHAASQLRVTSPGGFVPGVTAANVLTVSSRCRNLGLAQAVRALGLAESAGVGVDRMYAAMTAVGHEPPAFVSDGLTVEANLRGGPPNEPLARFVADLAEDRRGDPDTLLILAYLLTHRTVTASRIHRALQKTERESEEKLLELSSPGTALVERTADTARSRRGEYRLVGTAIQALGSAISYRARSGDDTDRKIIAIVRETGSINGRIVQTMFDVQPGTASRILSDLVERQILLKTSKATRGPSVKYGPGSKFPSRQRTGNSAEDGQDALDFAAELVDES